MTTQHIETIVIGGGQAGLAVGYYLAREHLPFVILDAHPRIGDAWRTRWDSLRLFSPARFDALPGLRFPAPPYAFPTKDQMADYLESYARQFELPVRSGRRVEQLARVDGHFVVTAGDERFEADNVVVAMSGWQQPRVPAFASELAPEIVQLHSSDYRNPQQLRDGAVLIVGAGNSGAEIAMDMVRSGHRTIVAGRSVGQVPFPLNAFTVRTVFPVLFRVLFHRLATTHSPLGRRMRRIWEHGTPLIRTRESQTWPRRAWSERRA